MQANQAFVGVPIFAVFAIMRRVRVLVWYGLHCEDVLQSYAPFISESITASAPFEVIGCRISRDEYTDARRLHVVEDIQNVNHWIACVPGSSHDGIGHAILEEASDDEQKLFKQCMLPWIALCWRQWPMVIAGSMC